MLQFCPQLKQNLENIKTLKSELALELPKLEQIFKIFKSGANPAELGYMLTPLSEARRDYKAERKELINKIKSIKAEIDLNSNKIKEKKDYFRELKKKAILDSLLKKLSPESRAYPEGTVEVGVMTIGQMSKAELIKELEVSAELGNKDENKIYISDDAKFLYNNSAFEVLKKPEEINLIRLTVKDLGFTKSATNGQIYQRAAELGLELCPPEVGLYLQLNFSKAFKREQPINDCPRVAMKQIFDSDRRQIFNLHRNDNGRRSLHCFWVEPATEWDHWNEFVFCFRHTK
jgi:hypothetical protein